MMKKSSREDARGAISNASMNPKYPLIHARNRESRRFSTSS
jgi:hypothetical protein